MIHINDKMRIKRIDEKCLQLEVYKETISKKTKEKSMKWKWAGYYGNMRSAFSAALSRQLFETTDEEIQLKEIINRIDLAEETILKAISQLEK